MVASELDATGEVAELVRTTRAAAEEMQPSLLTRKPASAPTTHHQVPDLVRIHQLPSTRGHAFGRPYQLHRRPAVPFGLEMIRPPDTSNTRTA